MIFDLNKIELTKFIEQLGCKKGGQNIVTDEQLKSLLKRTELNDCKSIIYDYIYYCKKPIKSWVFNENGNYGYSIDEYEFLIITNGDEKQGIILRCGTTDLHWLVLRRWRNRQVLSNALRTGIIHYVWPENKTVSCCYSWQDKMVYRPKKYNMTKHLSDLAGLKMKD